VNSTLTVTEAAKVLQCTDDTVRERALRGDLPGIKFGRDWVFPADTFYQALATLALEEAAQRRRVQQHSAVVKPLRGRESSPPVLP
jgi:excisionase family DNA binding protein